MKSLRKYIALILVLVMSITAFSSCQDTSDDDPQDDNFEETEDDITQASQDNSTQASQDGSNHLNEEDEGEAGFYIVTNALLKNGDVRSAAIDYLSNAIKAAYGETPKTKKDTGFKINNDSYTFIVGDTVLEQPDDLSSMKINDYGYKVVGEKLVVINGGSADSIKKAVTLFCKDVLTYDGKKINGPQNPTLTVGVNSIHNATYGNKSVSINGFLISTARIVVRTAGTNITTDINNAETLVKELGKHNGYSVPIVQRSELKGNEKVLIYLGTLDKDATNVVAAGYNGYRILVSSQNSKYSVGISGSNASFYKQAFSDFMIKIKSENGSDKVKITLPTETIQEYTYNFTNSNSLVWTLKNSTSESVADGIKYKVNSYTDTSGSPHIANILTIDLNKYMFSLGMPQSGAGTLQTLTGQMQYAVSQGKNVVAGVNGDIFMSNLMPRGLAISNGQVITKGYSSALGDYGTRGCFALSNSGEYMIVGNASTLNTSDIKMAVGVDYVLVNDGTPQPLAGIDSSQEFSLHPRTLVGLTYTNELILVTIDGRQSHSNGATLENAADLMASLGCRVAGSVDGGGSTEMVIRNGNSYDIKNTPSDGGERNIANSILIVKK